MRIERIEVVPVRLPMKAVLTLPRGPSRTLAEGKRVALVKITDVDGNVGWGEAGPSRRWSAETLESCTTSIREYLAPALVGHDVFDIAGAHAKMNRELATGLDPGQPVAKCAIDVALHDLVCRRLGIPLQAWLGAKRADRVPLARLVSAASPEEAARSTMEGLAEGYQGFKVKVGHHRELDVELVRAVKEAAPRSYVWPDANQAYTLEEAMRMAKAFEPAGRDAVRAAGADDGRLRDEKAAFRDLDDDRARRSGDRHSVRHRADPARSRRRAWRSRYRRSAASTMGGRCAILR